MGFALRRLAASHCYFRRQAVAAAENRGDGQRARALAIAQRHVMRDDVAIDVDGVPLRRVADVIDRYVVMLAPEEGRPGVALAAAEHVARGGLALALGHDPVLDAQPLAAVAIGPAGDVAGGVDAGHAGLEIVVDEHAAIDGEPR